MFVFLRRGKISKLFLASISYEFAEVICYYATLNVTILSENGFSLKRCVYLLPSPLFWRFLRRQSPEEMSRCQNCDCLNIFVDVPAVFIRELIYPES